MTSIVDSVADHLAAAGVLAGYEVFRGYEPPDPNKTICLIEFAGEPPETTFLADYPSFQVRVRGEPWQYEEVRDQAELIYQALHGASIPLEETVSPSGVAVYILARQQPYPVDHDDRDRNVVAFDCRSMRTL